MYRSSENEKSCFPVLKGPYLGQEPPGIEPKVFASGILNTQKMGAFCTVFSPDGSEFYYVSYLRGVDGSGRIHFLKRVKNIWTKPRLAPFSRNHSENDMCISSDGKKLIFRSWSALPSGKRPKNHSYLWIVERSEQDWQEAKPLLCGGEPVRTGYPSISRNNTLFFAHRRDNRLGIYCSRLVKNTYTTPEHVYTLFDQDFIHGDMFVAPDESYMIVSGRDPKGKIGSGRLDLYIIFRNRDGTWTEAINMGKKINTNKAGENCPQVSPDGKYFFFNRYNPDIKKGDMYWMDAKIIEELKPRK
jgi:hypothetical protein